MILDVALSQAEPVGRIIPRRAVVVIDVIRATTTITMALHNGCQEVIPVRTLNEARAAAQTLRGEVMLAAERGAIKVAGFELGNSPAEYRRERIEGKIVVLTTTNGTRAFRAVRSARVVIACTFLNISAAARWLRRADLDILIVCAGRTGRFCLEDGVAAGMLINRLLSNAPFPIELTDAAQVTQILYQAHRGDLLGMLQVCEWGGTIMRKGFGADLELCAQVDLTDVVPVLQGGRLIPERA